ncbi:related to DNA repair RAD50, ABC-type ATPase SMC superfamily [Lecanosticta acicola]|uniref:DNA repair protein RAD50 n=1 Tax=Lecanosticta acicola TaxID=111012 RepID=A0AAI8W0U9_9PEZI|nr:related to DNA repair RAD50, ABC-type ATPase SMC superfamily [Lecanosticta acicola]
MSKIDKLSILGVRSFDHQLAMNIQFHAPLTLIVGSNGSGKTTIIECLKYATCGVLPPNSAKGSSFVHDPALTGEKEVMAQVKISFTSVEGMKMVSTRSLQLTVKKATRSCKALEGCIRMLKDGERNVISSRVAEMDSLMPRFLGVSKAVLENVIFCHQEDSFWPLSQPAALKEKFDSIFEAQKYTRAIESIKVLQKNKRLELIQQKGEEDHMKADNEKAKKLSKNWERLEKQLEDLKSKKDYFSDQLREAETKAEEFYTKIGEAETVVGTLSGKRIARDTKEESIESLRNHLTELDASDDELKRSLAEHDERLKVYQTDLEKQSSAYHELLEDAEQIEKQLGSKERELGSHEAQKQSFDRQIESRKRLIRETAQTHEIRGLTLDIDEAQVKDFMERIAKKAQDKQTEFEQARSALQDDLQRQQKRLTKINEQKSAHKQSKETARQAITSYDRKISDLQSRQNNMEIDEGGKVVLESQLRDAQQKLTAAKAEMENASWDADIESAELELRTLEDRKDKLEAELLEATQRAGDSAQLDFVQKELTARQQSLETMMKAHGGAIGTLVGPRWTPASLEKDFQRTLENAVAQLSEAERQRNGTAQQVEYQSAKIKEVEKELQSAHSELKSAENAVTKVINGSQPQKYHEKVAELENLRDDVKMEKEAFDKVQKYLELCRKTGEQHNCCYTCTRPFKKEEQLQAMFARVKRELDKYCTEAPEAQSLDDIERELSAAKAVSSEFDTWERMKNKVIPEKQKALESMNSEHDHLNGELEDRDNAVRDKNSAKAEIGSHSRTVQSIVKYHAEIVKFEAQIQDLTEKQKSQGLSRGLEIIQSDKKKVDEQAKAASTRKHNAASDREKVRTRINSLELQISNTKGKLSAAEWQLKEKKDLHAQEEEYKNLNKEQREKISTADATIKDLDAEEKAENARYEDIASRGEEKDRILQNKANDLTSSVNKLKLADQEIQAYHDRGGDEPLNLCRREIENVKAELGRKKEDAQAVVRECNELKEKINNYDAVKRQIGDNQQYRRDLRALQDLQREIAALEQTNAEADKERYEKEVRQWQLRRREAAQQEASLAGQIKSIDDQLAQAMKDWDTDYKDTARRYREAHVMVETTKAAIEDLGRYAGALDKAIMKYHSLKMDEINQIVAELWRKTYMGTDVDTILIRSESESVKANKSYNYRVCMVKQDTEMDMRGRCSAGQKVLACIIIRLALAECFGVNCGLIALDEPTTNLDSDNIRALAQSLSEIIRLRRAQSNFQIIVITHDEEFLKHMNGSDYVDDYYRVSRDQRQNSVIDKQHIGEIS